MNAAHLRRVDPVRNMRRFYRLDAQPDLFGGVLLIKEWGRIGAQGRVVAERYESEALALAALQRHAERKRRRGYGDILLSRSIASDGANIFDQHEQVAAVGR